MLFTTYQFALFLFILFLIYYIAPKKYQWLILLIGSYVFYAFSGIGNLFYFLTTTLSTYLVSLQIDKLTTEQKAYLKAHKMKRPEKKAYRNMMKAKKWKWLLAALLFNFGVLGVVKYTNFMIGNINGIIGIFHGQPLSFMNIALPMGISFYTFMSMGYLIDVYRGKTEVEHNLLKLALFVSFFPQVIQGPISRFKDLSQTLYNEHEFDLHQISFGVQRILWGYFKKLVIADRILVGVKALIAEPETYSGFFVFVGMIFYAIELYADFTGGIDITIGIAETLGVKVVENFDRPYFSKNIAEYWRRWHITMGSWFRDYIFYPLSVSPRMLNFSLACQQKLPKGLGKRVPVYVSSFIVWFATGIWHGASWNFIVWGLMNALVITVSEEFKPFYNWFHSKFNVAGKYWYDVFQMVRTFLLMCSLRIFDCYRDVPLSFKMFGTMFTKFNVVEVFKSGALMKIGLNMTDYIIIAVGIVIMWAVSMLQSKGEREGLDRPHAVREMIDTKPVFVKFLVFYVLIFAIVLLGAYSIGYDSSQFIYNQF